MNYTVKPNQSMADVIIQSLGSMEGGMQFCRDNAIAISDTPTVGAEVMVTGAALALGDAGVRQYYAQNEVVAANLNLKVCGVVHGLMVSDITADGGVVSWTALAGAIDYVYQVNESPTMPGDYTGHNTLGSTTLYIGGHSAGTTLYAWVYTVCSETSHSGWVGISFTTSAPYYSRSLTIDHTKCGSSDSTNLPVLVNITHNTLKTLANGGHVNNASGYDVQFFLDEAMTVSPNWEVELYDASAGHLIAWVKIPTVTHSANTVFYLQYGNPGITTFQGGVKGAAWASDIKAVLEMGNGATVDLTDKTANGNNATNVGALAAAGKINGGINTTFSGHFTTPSIHTIVSGSEAWSVSFWMVADGTGGGGATPIVFGSDGASDSFVQLGYEGSNVAIFWLMGGVYRQYIIPAFTHLVLCHFVIEKTGSGDNGNLYYNGVLQTPVSGTIGDDPVSTTTYFGVFRDGSSDPLTSIMDQLVIRNAVKSADYWLATYNTQNAPGDIGAPGFLTISAEL